MSATEASSLMTTEEMLAMPGNGTVRELVRGELRETPMTRRNQWHCSIESLVSHLLLLWLGQQEKPRGRVVSGEAGFRLASNPDTSVGIDVAYISPEVLANTPRTAAFFEGPPTLAVEILSPSDTQHDVDEKIEIYQGAGVPVVWIVQPKQRTVTVFRRGEKPRLFNEDEVIPEDPHLPGFRVAVAEIFDF